MCWFDPITGHQVVKPQERLAVIFTEVQKFYKVQGAGTVLTNLKLSMFTNEKSPHQSHAFLDAKGGECKWLAPALLEVMKKMLGPERDHHAHTSRAKNLSPLPCRLDMLTLGLAHCLRAHSVILRDNNEKKLAYAELTHWEISKK